MSKTAFDPANPPAPADAHKLIAKIAVMLGVDDPTDFDAVENALKSLFAAVAGERARNATTRRTLTASERAAADALGCSPKDFLAAKAAFRK